MSKNIKESVEDLTMTTQQYLESSIAYYKLDFFKKSMKATISGFHKMILAFFFMMFLLFVSIAGSIYLGVILNSTALGFLIVGGFYFLIMILCAAFLKPYLQEKLLTKFSTSYFNDEKETTLDEPKDL